MDWFLEVYDKEHKKITVLDKAYNISYEMESNSLSYCSFSLSLNDEKSADCKAFNYIKLYENGVYLDTFRIMPKVMKRESSINEISYDCEHVLGTLLDNSLFSYHEIGGIGTFTNEVLNYILSKQDKWVLGFCEFKRQFQYSWENENLLTALFSIPKDFDEEYIFDWDTSVYPFILHLKRPSNEVKAYLRYQHNLKAITKTEDARSVCTRLHPLGYGEGINQLNIEKINPTGKAYIDSDTQNEYGIIEKIWVDRRYQIEENLFQAAKNKLEALKRPTIRYEIDATELYRLTNIEIHKFVVGDLISVKDLEAGIDIKTRISKKSKTNIEKDDISVEIEISSDNQSTGLGSLAERAKINENYSQGATNINNYGYRDNCDSRYPAIVRFKIPEEAVNINKVELSFKSDPFRAYSRAILGGGSTITSTGSGGGTYTSTESDGGIETSTESGGGAYRTSDVQVLKPGVSIDSTASGGGDGHIHDLYNHGHTVDIPDHRHRYSVPNHKHKVDTPSHQHDIRLEDHEHDIEHGIYEGASASKFEILVDGNKVNLDTTADDFNIVDYLSKDDSGRINRSWHEVLIKPNNLAMITADLMVQVFVNSRGGGNF